MKYAIWHQNVPFTVKKKEARIMTRKMRTVRGWDDGVMGVAVTGGNLAH